MGRCKADGISPQDIAKAKSVKSDLFVDVGSIIAGSIGVGLMIVWSYWLKDFQITWFEYVIILIWILCCIGMRAADRYARQIEWILYGTVMNMETKDIAVAKKGLDFKTLPYYYQEDDNTVCITKTFFYIDVFLESTGEYVQHIPCRQEDFEVLEKGGRVMVIWYRNNNMLALTVSSVSGK